MVNLVAVEQAAAAQGYLAEAQARSGSGNHPVEARRPHLFSELPDLAPDVLDQAPFVARRERIRGDEAIGQPDDAQREAAGEMDLGSRSQRHLDRTAPDVHDNRRPARRVHAVGRRQVDEPRFFGARDDAGLDSRQVGDGREKLAAVRTPRGRRWSRSRRSRRPAWRRRAGESGSACRAPRRWRLPTGVSRRARRPPGAPSPSRDPLSRTTGPAGPGPRSCGSSWCRCRSRRGA